MAEYLRAVTLPLAGVKVNTKFEQCKAWKGCFMNEKTKVTAAPTLELLDWGKKEILEFRLIP